MTVGQFVNTTKGCRHIRFQGQSKSLCGSDFFKKYRKTIIWDAEIDSVDMDVERKDPTGLWYDHVVCTITLKDKHLESELVLSTMKEGCCK